MGGRTVIRIEGFCPEGCGRTLQVEEMQARNRIICMADGCPSPLSMHQIANDEETEHIVEFDEAGFTIRHPLRERVTDLLLNCLLHQECAEHPDLMGRYRATTEDRVWTFERAER